MDILEEEVQDLQYLDEASIQSELEEEENMQLDINEAMQNIDREVKMKETERKTKMETAFEDLNPLLQRYNMKCVARGKYKLHCNIDANHRYACDANKLYCIRNHWEIHHGPKNMIYNEIKHYYKCINILLQNYKITDGTLATCSECEYSENLEKDNELYLDIFIIMRDHYNQIHRYKTNIF